MHTSFFVLYFYGVARTLLSMSFVCVTSPVEDKDPRGHESRDSSEHPTLAQWSFNPQKVPVRSGFHPKICGSGSIPIRLSTLCFSECME